MIEQERPLQEGQAKVSIIAVSWENHRRMVGLSEGLQIPLHVLVDGGGRLSRYLKLGWRTLRLFAKHRPRTVLVQNPSLILALLACLARPLWGFKLIVDAHNEAVEPYINTYWPIPALARWVMAKADITIVTNDYLAIMVSGVGGRPFVLPDRLPAIDFKSPPELHHSMDVMVIATYAPDEPIADIISAARNIPGDFRFFITGNDAKLAADVRSDIPKNVALTGFLSEEEYWQRMISSHVVLDLTLMPNCLVCGAYEGLALGRPMILSANPPTEAIFGQAAVLTLPFATDIRAALLEARSRYTVLATNVEKARDAYRAHWEDLARSLRSEFLVRSRAS